MEYVLVLSLVFSVVDYVTSGEMCPFHLYGGIFGQTVKFSFCRQGCCGSRLHDVCCSRPPVYLIIGCVFGGAAVVVAVVIIAYCFYARAKNNTRRVIRASVYPAVFHTESTHMPQALDNYDMYRPPPYEVVTSGQDKPPSYADAIRLGMGQPVETNGPPRGELDESDCPHRGELDESNCPHRGVLDCTPDDLDARRITDRYGTVAS